MKFSPVQLLITLCLSLVGVLMLPAMSHANNLVVDGDMEMEHFDEWRIYGAPGRTWKTNEASMSGQYSMFVSTTPGLRGGFQKMMTHGTPVEVEAGGTYALNFNYKFATSSGYISSMLGIRTSNADFENGLRFIRYSDLEWHAAEERIFTVPEEYTHDFRIIISSRWTQAFIDDLSVTYINQAPSSTFVDSGITITTHTVHIAYTTFDRESDMLNFNQSDTSGIEYRVGDGAWIAAQEADDVASEGRDNISSNADEGEQHTFVWDARAQLNGENTENIQVRIRPADASQSAAVWTTTDTFQINWPALPVAEEEEEEEVTPAPQGGGGGGGYIARQPPRVLTFDNGQDMPAVEIVPTDDPQIVHLQFHIADAAAMAIAHTPDFIGASFIPFARTMQWEVPPGHTMIYVKFRANDGSTFVVEQRVALETATTTPQLITPTSTQRAVGGMPPADISTTTPEKASDAPHAETHTGGPVHCIMPPSFAYRSIETDLLFYITASCTKQLLPQRVLKSYADDYWFIYTTSDMLLHTIPFDTVATVPYGPRYVVPDGSLVKTALSNKVYLIIKNKRYWITDEETLSLLGRSLTEIITVTPTMLEQFETGPNIGS